MTLSKRVFLWTHLAKVSDNYHEDGGLVVIAADRDEVVALIADRDIEITPDEWAKVREFPLAGEHHSDYFPFPDAGCC